MSPGPQVRDVQRTAAFFERHFDFRRTTSHSSPAIAVLEGDVNSRGTMLYCRARR